MADEQNNHTSSVGTASAELRAIVEALIFASPEPVTLKMLFKLLADEPKEDVVGGRRGAQGRLRAAAGPAVRRGGRRAIRS